VDRTEVYGDGVGTGTCVTGTGWGWGKKLQYGVGMGTIFEMRGRDGDQHLSSCHALLNTDIVQCTRLQVALFSTPIPCQAISGTDPCIYASTNTAFMYIYDCVYTMYTCTSDVIYHTNTVPGYIWH